MPDTGNEESQEVGHQKRRGGRCQVGKGTDQVRGRCQARDKKGDARQGDWGDARQGEGKRCQAGGGG
jgi:hypothetical protein